MLVHLAFCLAFASHLLRICLAFVSHSPRIPLSRLWTWQRPTKMLMSHFCRATHKTAKNLDVVGVHLPCIWRAFDNNIVHSAEKLTSANMLRHGESKANTRRVQGKHEANMRWFKFEHVTSPRQTRGIHKSAWSWLEVGLKSAWIWLEVGLK